MKCKYCGKDNPDDAVLCSECGTELEEAKPKKNLKWLIVLGIVLAGVFTVTAILAIVIAAILYFVPAIKMPSIFNSQNNTAIFDQLDYSLIAAELVNYNDEIVGAYISDVDNDGRQELVEVYEYGEKNRVFDTSDNLVINHYNEEGLAGIEASEYTLMQKFTSNYFETRNYSKLISGYEERLKNVVGDGYRLMESDFDGDGESEFVFIIENFLKRWRNYESNEEYVYIYVIYADGDKNGVVFHSFWQTFTSSPKDSFTVKWDNCMLTLESQYGEYAYFFCNRLENSKDCENSSINETIQKYTYFLDKHLSCDDIRVKQVDVCDVPGSEFTCVYRRGATWYFTVYAVWNGSVIPLYQQYNMDTRAVYLVEIDSKMYMLNYIQNAIGDAYWNEIFGYEYKFWCTRFDNNYMPIDSDERSVSVYDESAHNENTEQFFNLLDQYLNKAIVCVDRYELTGYSVMPNNYVDYTDNINSKYLSISNCDINKRGTVRVDTWLNLREGPSVGYNMILTNPYNPESFVMQTDGSSVTIIDTVNTGNYENPIWVKIQIKYQDKTLIGYSSQRYIDIPNIRHLRVGETFTVKASTNDTGLTWSGNDYSVLDVDYSTGRVTALKPGLVMVSVESDSGLRDSCLIMVD